MAGRTLNLDSVLVVIPYKSSGADPSAPRASGVAALDSDAVLGPQDGT
jgi:hypothetical protein